MDTLQNLKHLLLIQSTNQPKLLFVWVSKKNIFALEESFFYPLHSLYSHQLWCLISKAKQKSTEIVKWDNISQSNTLSSIDSIFFCAMQCLFAKFYSSQIITYKWMISSFCYLGMQLGIECLNGNVGTLLKLIVLYATLCCSFFLPSRLLNNYLIGNIKNTTVQSSFDLTLRYSNPLYHKCSCPSRQTESHGLFY